jgi:hypothetical protein
MAQGEVNRRLERVAKLAIVDHLDAAPLKEGDRRAAWLWPG